MNLKSIAYPTIHHNNRTEEYIVQFTDYGKTEPIDSFNGFNDIVGPSSFSETEPIGNDSTFSGPTEYAGWDAPQPSTEPATLPIGEDGGFTLPDSELNADTPNAFQFESSEPTQVVSPEGTYSFMPVVGWLVCIEGNDRGRDFRLHAGYNSIGKNPENDVSIPSDHTISRDRHAVIAYDQEENLYFFAPANGVNLLRLNGKVLMSPSEIKANDVLTIGKSKLLFIPLCSDKFQWGNDEE